MASPATLHSPAVGSVGTLGGSGRAEGGGPRSSSFLSRTFAWPSCSPRSSRVLARTLGEEWALRGRGGLWGELRARLGDAGRALGVAGDEGRFLGVAGDEGRFLGVAGDEGRFLGAAGDEGRFLGPGLQTAREHISEAGAALGGVKGWEASRSGVLTCCQLQAGAGAVPPAVTAAS